VSSTGFKSQVVNLIHIGLSRNAIFNAVDATLKRLDLEYMDLLQIHRFDPYTPVEETMEALHDLIKLGKVRYIGASSMYTYQFALMQFWYVAQSADFAIMQKMLTLSAPRRMAGPSSSACRISTVFCTVKRRGR